MVDWLSSGDEQLAVSDFLGRVATNYEWEKRLANQCRRGQF
jgi:hypothetical protein